MAALEPAYCPGANKRTQFTALRSRALLVKERSFVLCSKEARVRVREREREIGREIEREGERGGGES